MPGQLLGYARAWLRLCSAQAISSKMHGVLHCVHHHLLLVVTRNLNLPRELLKLRNSIRLGSYRITLPLPGGF